MAKFKYSSVSKRTLARRTRYEGRPHPLPGAQPLVFKPMLCADPVRRAERAALTRLVRRGKITLAPVTRLTEG